MYIKNFYNFLKQYVRYPLSLTKSQPITFEEALNFKRQPYLINKHSKLINGLYKFIDEYILIHKGDYVSLRTLMYKFIDIFLYNKKTSQDQKNKKLRRLIQWHIRGYLLLYIKDGKITRFSNYAYKILE